MTGWFNKRLHIPVEKRNYGTIYAALSLLLFLGTFWAVYDEIESRRPWKDYQERFQSFKSRVLKYKLKQAYDKVGKGGESEFRKIDAELKKVNQQMRSGEMVTVNKKVDDLAEEIRSLSLERANLKAIADNRNYLFEHGRRQGHLEEADEYRAERTELEGEMAALDEKISALEKQRADLVAQKVKPLADKRTALETRRDSLFGHIAELRTKITEVENEPTKIEQVMLVDFDRSNFGNVKMRADRCQSCHMGINDPVVADTSIYTQVGKGKVFGTKEAAERYRKVFGPHPQSELLQLHPIEKFGCTGCHGGQPMAVDDVEHAHGIQEYWERPLLKGGYMEANCRRCHEGSYNFMTMERVSQGRKLFVDLGCFGCHDGPAVPDFKAYKVGPSLVNLSKKVTPQWTYQWIMNPTRWNEHTRMPNFRFTSEETEAVVAYLFDASKNSIYQPVSSAAPSGDPARGAQVFREVGCVACHAIDEFKGRGEFKFAAARDTSSLWPNASRSGNRVAEGNMFGPELNKVGSKVTAEWLFDWVKNPKHYNANSRMPSLRLSDGEAADLTAYLMSKREANPVAPHSMPHLGDPKWIERGGKLIREYGCFGCHEIQGMEKEGKVSVALNDFGDKHGADLFFGYLTEGQLHSVRHHFDTTGYPLGELFEFLPNGEDWFTWTALKMKNPRVFATDAIPQKMPVFNMTDEEAYSLTVALRSHTKSYIPASYKDPAGELQPVLDEGRFLVHWNNCVACHTVEKHGGYVKEILRAMTGLKGDDILPYAPPNLNTIGVKAQEDWFYRFIRNPASEPVRTWLNIRMPTYDFTPSEIAKLDKFFLGIEGKDFEFTDYSYYPASDQTIAAGRDLFERLKCQQCHAVGGSPANGGATAVPAPNLALAGNRLQPEWIARWIRDPQKIVPGTKMPNFFGTWEEPTSPYPDILGGDWQAQINALRDYVWRIGGAKGVMPGSTTQSTEMVRTVTDSSRRAPEVPSQGRISFR